MTLYKLAKHIETLKIEALDLVRKERPYQIPKGYLHWKVLSAIVALSLETYEDGRASADAASFFNAYRTALWFLQDAPIYCIKKELLRAFEKSEVENNPKLLADLQIALPTFLLLFPENSIISPEGGTLDYCVVHIGDRAHPEWSSASAYGYTITSLEQEHERVIHYCGADSKEVVWFSGRGIESDGSIHYTRSQLGTEPTTDADEEFVGKIRNIVIQCLLAMTYEPHLLENSENVVAGDRKMPVYKNKPHHKNPEIRRPRWLGKDYQPKYESSSYSRVAISPSMHWRSGHWRRVPIGLRKLGQRKWVWIEPVLVNG